MIHRLDAQHYSRVLPLLRGALPGYAGIITRAVVAGNSTGAIWVDSMDHPCTALIRDKRYCYCLMGDANNATFNLDLQTLITGEIAPTALGKGPGIFKLFFSSQEWEAPSETIFTAAELRRRERTLFTFDRPALPDWRSRIPSGAEIRPIDADLLAGQQGAGPVVEEILSTWESVDVFLERGFGSCLLFEGQVACWCTAEYVEGTMAGVGIETLEEYWNRGFATLTAAAFVQGCVERGRTPCWDAWTANLPSHAVALKAGFKEAATYPVYLGKFNRS